MAKSIRELFFYTNNPKEIPKKHIYYPKSNLDNQHFHIPTYSKSISTYPKNQKLPPIADSYQVKSFEEGSIVALSDGCGLSYNSSKASQAAIEGFFNFIHSQSSNECILANHLAHILFKGIQAAHLNIFWNSYIQQKKPSNSYKDYLMSKITQKEKKIAILKKHLQTDSNVSFFTQFSHLNLSASHNIHQTLTLDQKKVSVLKEEHSLISKALSNDLYARFKLMEREWDYSFYKKRTGATTFLTAVLAKSTSKISPYVLLLATVGDSQAFLIRDNKVYWLTKSPRPEHINLRDPGGRIGQCSINPLKPDFRNLQFSFCHCFPNDKIFFVTDGISDNLDPMNLGITPKGNFSSNNLRSLFIKSTNFSDQQLKTVTNSFRSSYDRWIDTPSLQAKELKENFSRNLLQELLFNTTCIKASLNSLIQYCSDITALHRSNLQNEEDLSGKPDHTTGVVMQLLNA